MLRFRSIDQSLEKIKIWAIFIKKKEIYNLFALILVGFGGYFLGNLSNFDKNRGSILLEQFDTSTKYKTESKVLNQNVSTQVIKVTETDNNKGMYVGSRNGNKYHLPNCPGAERILEANSVWFSSKEDALRAGYTPAANCKGI